MNFIFDSWTPAEYNNLVNYLKEISDKKYSEFHRKLTPGASNILGVQLPKLRLIAKDIARGNYSSYLKLCRSEFYEESMLEGIVIGLSKPEYTEFLRLIDGFADKINNWAVCDSFSSGLKMLKKYKIPFFSVINKYLESENPWHKRLGLVIMMDYYITEDYISEVLQRCDNISFDHYYVKMAQAWLVSVAYVKFPEITYEYLKRSKLDNWTFNKAIQKTRESFRVSDDIKQILNQMKRK
jgi:3-methyladenine DNA glycosylase AlkD